MYNLWKTTSSLGTSSSANCSISSPIRWWFTSSCTLRKTDQFKVGRSGHKKIGKKTWFIFFKRSRGIGWQKSSFMSKLNEIKFAGDHNEVQPCTWMCSYTYLQSYTCTFLRIYIDRSGTNWSKLYEKWETRIWNQKLECCSCGNGRNRL